MKVAAAGLRLLRWCGVVAELGRMAGPVSRNLLIHTLRRHNQRLTLISQCAVTSVF